MNIQDSYNTEGAQWEAYQFSDPFATGAFICCNKKNDKFCRPNCDYYPKVGSKDEVLFVDDVGTAESLKYSPCEQCDPTNPSTEVDLAVIKMTIDAINRSIGFTNDANDLKRRAFSVPSINTTDGHLNDRQLTRNETEHIKLVELACRHIATAAANSISKQQDDSKFGSNATAASNKKKRRGGVLGFKELASKSKLSPWHFHRVFKSVTGLTPKSYGDQCWKFIKSHGHPQTKRQRAQFKNLTGNGYNVQSSSSNTSANTPKVPAKTPVLAKKEMEFISPKSSITRPDNEITIPMGNQQQRMVKKSETPSQSVSQVQFNYVPYNYLMPQLQANSEVENRNSLDINLAPARHHSIDLGSAYMNAFENSKFDNFPTDTKQYMQQDPHQIPNQFQMNSDLTTQTPLLDTLQGSLPLLQTTLSENDPNLNASAQEIATLSLNSSMPINESEWPSLEGSTPASISYRHDTVNLLTPPSTISEGADYTESCGYLYDLDNSPLNSLNNDGDLLMNLNEYNYSALKNGDGYRHQSELSFDNDHDDMFEQITTLNTTGRNGNLIV